MKTQTAATNEHAALSAFLGVTPNAHGSHGRFSSILTLFDPFLDPQYPPLVVTKI
jgi:hypothetical protein